MAPNNPSSRTFYISKIYVPYLMPEKNMERNAILFAAIIKAVGILSTIENC
jgi:hypothetical protein